MTRLELANKFRRKSGTPGTFTTTLNHTGEQGDLIDWLDQAYEMVQIHYDTWLFLRDEFSFNTTQDVSEYAATDIASDFASWYPYSDDYRCYRAGLGVTDEQYMHYIDWDDFRRKFDFGFLRETTGRPVYWTIKPDKTIKIYPIPSRSHTIIGEYFKTPDVMDADADEPIFDVRYQWIIVWKALALYGADSGEVNKEATGNKYYNQIIKRMSQQYLPTFNVGGPLA